MFKRVVVDIDQEVTDEDLERMGAFPQDGVRTLTDDLLVSGRLFKGFTVTATGTTAIEVTAGRIYDAGAMYAMEADLDMSVAGYVPFLAGQQVYVTLIGQGREVDGYVEARNYEREIAQSGGGTAIQQVPATAARARVREAVLTLYPGAPSAAPQKPSVPAGAVGIADILIGTGGIVAVTRRTENEAPELDVLAAAYTALSDKFKLVDQEIAGLRNDLAALAARLRGGVSYAAFRAVVGDVAVLKDTLAIPDTGSPYGADRFLATTESDVGNVDYKATVQEGIRFPAANEDKSPIAVYNPNDPNLRHAAAGFVCAKYTAVEGLSNWTRAGSVPLGGTTYQTMELKQLTMSRSETCYGDWFTVCENASWWQSGQYDPVAGILRIGAETYEVGGAVDNLNWAGHRILRVRKYWTTTVVTPYDYYAPVTHPISGVLKGQTWVQSQERYAPGVWLGIDRWSAGSEITAALVECHDSGTPNKDRALATVTLAASQFQVYPAATNFPFSVPVLLEAGKTYALVFATTGEVYAASSEGQKFLQGTLFDSTDGVFFSGDLTKDLCFGVRYCRFDYTSLPVLLQGVNLDGGIHNIRIRAGTILPQNAAIQWQLQVGGTWRTIEAPEGDDTLFGAGVTPYYDFRVLITGTQWAMPLLDLGASEVHVFRADDDFSHVSTAYAFSSAVTGVEVRETLSAWEAARHTAVVTLLYGASYASTKTHATVTTKPVVGADGLARTDAVEKVWTFSFDAPGVTAVKIRTVGTTNNARRTYLVEQRIHTTE
jgi:hypothetical protein